MAREGNWPPTARPAAIRARAELQARIRQFFAERGVLEVTTPILSMTGNSDPAMRQFRAEPHGRYLRSSPEYALKRLLAAGSGDIYELGPAFRDEPPARGHNHEFTLLEWYRVGWTARELASEVAELIDTCHPRGGLPRKHLTYRELFLDGAGIDPFEARLEDLRRRAEDLEYEGEPLGRNGLLDLLMALVIQPSLPDHQLTLVRDFPADQAALAKVRAGTPPVAERFEVFLGSVELANGYQELTCPGEQRARFVADNRRRRERGAPEVAPDERLLAALEAGLPECAGVALGVDRLLMCTLEVRGLAEVIAFPGERA